MKLCRIHYTIIMAVALVKREALAISGGTGERIYGGVEVKKGDAPFQVSFQASRIHFCGGSIVDPNFIVTAAHCCLAATRSKTLDSLKIVAGLNNLSRPEEGFQEITIAGIMPHPNYKRGRPQADICILQLKDPLILAGESRTAMIQLPPPEYTASGYANVTGWGLTNDGTRPDALMRVTIPIVPDNACRQSYAPEVIVDEMICAGAKGKGGCFGDSGGPLVDSQGFMVGVVSGGRACGSAMYPGIFTEVSYFTQWIKNHMLVNSAPEDPVSS